MLIDFHAHAFLDKLAAGAVSSLAQRAHSRDISRCSSDHQTGLLTDGLNLICIFIISDNRRFTEHNAFAADIHKNAGSS